MRDTSESETGLAKPYLLGCDLQGRIVWMSDRAQAELGSPENLPAEFTGRMRAGSSFWIWPVLTLPNTLVIGAEEERQIESGRVGVDDKPQANGGRVVRQMELERQRLGRELHTGVGQMLVAIRLQREVIVSQIPDPPEAVQKALEAIGRLASEALEQVRSISRRVHPPEWQRLTLEAALGQLWEVSGIPQLFQARVSIQQLSHEPAHEIKVLFYRVAQEALANIARHSGASEAEMALDAKDGTLSLTIRDNGHGFDPSGIASAPANIEAGIGLRSIREEAADLGATLEIRSGPDGTTISVLAHCAPAG